MIRLLKRFYKKAPNHKMELLGIDGLEHAVIELFVLVTIFSIFTFIMNKFIGFYAVCITGIIMTFVWYWIEHTQEKAMWGNHKTTRIKNLWNPLKWSKARKVDMVYPLLIRILIIVSLFFMVYLKTQNN